MLDSLRRLYYYIFKPEFTVRITDRAAALVQGKLRRHIVEDFSKIAESREIDSGIIFGIGRQSGTGLVFSANIDTSDRQRFRNCFASS